MKYSLLSICLCLAVSLCLKMGSGNMVLMRLGSHIVWYKYLSKQYFITIIFSTKYYGYRTMGKWSRLKVGPPGWAVVRPLVAPQA